MLSFEHLAKLFEGDTSSEEAFDIFVIDRECLSRKRNGFLIL